MNTRHRAKPGRLSQIRALLCASVALPVVTNSAVAADLDAGTGWTPEPLSSSAFAARWNSWASLGGAWNSDTESFGEFVIFAPFWQDSDSLFFAEARGRYFEDDLLAGNAALGLRQMTDSGFNLGGWLGLDVFQSVSDNTFGQVSGGIEALSNLFRLPRQRLSALHRSAEGSGWAG
jgi:hypothetical protein